jgi:hypothetical protein
MPDIFIIALMCLQTCFFYFDPKQALLKFNSKMAFIINFDHLGEA